MPESSLLVAKKQNTLRDTDKAESFFKSMKQVIQIVSVTVLDERTEILAGYLTVSFLRTGTVFLTLECSPLSIDSHSVHRRHLQNVSST